MSVLSQFSVLDQLIDNTLQYLQKQITETPSEVDLESDYDLHGYEFTHREKNAPNPQKAELQAQYDEFAAIGHTQTKFRDELTEDGFTVLATMPASVWHQVCSKFNWIRFENVDRESYTGANLSNLLRVPVVIFSGILAMIFVLILFYEMYSNFVHNPNGLLIGAPGNSFDDVVIFTISAFVLLFWLFILDGLSRIPRTINLLNTRLLIAVATLSQSIWWRKILFSKGVDGVRDEESVKISFPAPPEAVQSILVKLKRKGWQTMTAAPLEAVAFGKTKPAPLESNVDPVVYVKKYGMVAILAAYGNVPSIEKIEAAAQACDLRML